MSGFSSTFDMTQEVSSSMLRSPPFENTHHWFCTVLLMCL